MLRTQIPEAICPAIEDEKLVVVIHAARVAATGARKNWRTTIAPGMRRAFAPTMSRGFGRQTSGAVRLSPRMRKPCFASPPMIRCMTCAPAIGSPFGMGDAVSGAA